MLVEGFKRESFDKLEVWRSETGKPPLWRDDDRVLAVASLDPKPEGFAGEWFDLNDLDAIALFVKRQLP